MDRYRPLVNTPASTHQGLTLLQEVRGRYLSIHYDVPALLQSYVRLLDQLGIMTGEMRTCRVSQKSPECLFEGETVLLTPQLALFSTLRLQLQCRLLYESHSALYHLLKRMHIDSSETRAAEVRFAGGLELAWHAIQPLHTAIQEFKTLDDMESWFRYEVIGQKLSELWKLLQSAFVEFRDELQSPVEPFVALEGTNARMLVVPGQADVAYRQVVRADQLEQPKLFRQLVDELDAGTSLLFMKPFYIEEFMEAMQKVRGPHSPSSFHAILSFVTYRK